ncbi:MAG: hypothetical protein ACKVQK_25475 [Burkholderiales bacterium]
MLAGLSCIGLTTQVVDSMSADRWAVYEYATEVANTAAQTHLEVALAPVSRFRGREVDCAP